jgi:N-hydroxyarylamine O-acetyltransferase
VFDLAAYLDRIGLDGSPGLAEIHRAHVAAIPFENLDPHRGVPVSLAAEDLERKLVAERRGGYCFEHNLLLKSALEALGAAVELVLGRVRWGAPPGTVRPRSHLLLRVRDGGGALWHADVGFGVGTLREPIPFGAGDVYEQAGWRFRVAKDGEELVLQVAGASGWEDQYGFVPRAVPLVDVETSNWFTSTHPRSPFVTGLVASIQSADGSRTMLSDWSGALELTEHRPHNTAVTPVDRDAIPGLLAERFGLEGFGLDAGGRVV